MLLVCVSAGSLPSAVAQIQSTAGSDLHISVAGVTYTQSTEKLVFTVNNNSAKALLGYELLVTYSLPDGTKASFPYTADHVETLPLVGNSIAPPGTQIGPILAGRQEHCGFVLGASSAAGSIVDVTVTVVAAVYDDNSVEGDNARALNDIFQRRQALSTEYEAYISALRAIPIGSDSRMQLDQLRQKYSTAGDGENAFSRDPNAYAHVLRSYYKRLAWQLNYAIDRIDSGQKSASGILASEISSAQAMHAAFVAHSTPQTATVSPLP